MRWDTFLGAVLYSEADTLYSFNADGTDLGVTCFRNNSEQSDCGNLRLALENHIVRNLRAFCDGSNYGETISIYNGFQSVPPEFMAEFTPGNRCSGAEVIYWLAGMPKASAAEGRISGIQGIYQAANDDGSINFSEFGDTGDPSTAQFDVLGFDRRMREAMIRTSDQCANCTWGNVESVPDTEFFALFDDPSEDYGAYFRISGLVSLE